MAYICWKQQDTERGLVCGAVGIFLLAIGVILVALAVASVSKIEVQSCLTHCANVPSAAAPSSSNYAPPNLPSAPINGSDACQPYIILSNVSRESTTAYATIAAVAAITAPVGALSLINGAESTKAYIAFVGTAASAQVVTSVLATIQLLVPTLTMKPSSDEPCLWKDNAGMDASTLQSLGKASAAFLCTGAHMSPVIIVIIYYGIS